MQPAELYQKMFSFYGAQHWWPGEGFEIAIGAVLTQNTSWHNVKKALENLRREQLLEPKAILSCDVQLLKQLIAPVGFFNQKAHYLRNLCKLWITNPRPTREELLAVKGIGEETADSILLYLFEETEFVIDTYTVRISVRLGLGSSQKKQFWKGFYETRLVKDAKVFNEFHALFVAHAQNFCKKKNPLCHKCFLLDSCDFGKKKIEGISQD